MNSNGQEYQNFINEELYTDDGDAKCSDCGGVMLLSYVSDVYGFNRTWTCDRCGNTESE